MHVTLTDQSSEMVVVMRRKPAVARASNVSVAVAAVEQLSAEGAYDTVVDTFGVCGRAKSLQH